MTDKTISVYWFFILFIVASAIVFLVYTPYGTPLDVRQMEAIFLAEKTADCVSQAGKLTIAGETLVKEGATSDILRLCGLTFKVEKFKEYWNDDQLFVSVNFSSEVKDFPAIVAGNPNLRSNCNVNSLNLVSNLNSKTKKFPICVDRTINSVGEDKNAYSIKIFTGVRKTEKNA